MANLRRIFSFGLLLLTFVPFVKILLFSHHSPALASDITALGTDNVLVYSGNTLIYPSSGNTYVVDFSKPISVEPILKGFNFSIQSSPTIVFNVMRIYREEVTDCDLVGLIRIEESAGRMTTRYVVKADGSQFSFKEYLEIFKRNPKLSTDDELILGKFISIDPSSDIRPFFTLPYPLNRSAQEKRNFYRTVALYESPASHRKHNGVPIRYTPTLFTSGNDPNFGDVVELHVRVGVIFDNSLFTDLKFIGSE